VPYRKELADHVRDATFTARREYHRQLLDDDTLPEWVGEELLRLQRSFQLARGPKKRRAAALRFERAVFRRALREGHPLALERAFARVLRRFEVAARQGRGLALDPIVVQVVYEKLDTSF
jgi:hypothetical protein